MSEAAAGQGASRPLAVLIADDQPEVRSALRLVVEQLVGYRVSDEAANAVELLSAAEVAGPDVVLLDWELPERLNGGVAPPLALLDALRRQSPGTRVVAMSARHGARAEAIAAGADAFVSKGDPPRRLIEALRGLW